MNNLELISIIISIVTSIIGLVISGIALYISSKISWRNNKINNTIINAWNFINIYQYLTKVRINHYDPKWKQDNYFFWLIYKQEIFQESIIHIFPNIKNISYFQSLNFNNEKIFFDILNKSLLNLDETLKNAKSNQIKKTFKYWKLLFKKINNIQKWLINDLNIIQFEKKDKNGSLVFVDKNKYQEFLIEFYLDINQIKMFKKFVNNKKLTKYINKKNEIESINKGIIKNYKTIKKLMNKINPKIKFLILKSNLFLLCFLTEDGKEIKVFYDRLNKLTINEKGDCCV